MRYVFFVFVSSSSLSSSSFLLTRLLSNAWTDFHKILPADVFAVLDVNGGTAIKVPPPKKNGGSKRPFFGAKIQTSSSGDGRCAEKRRNSEKSKTTDIATISRLRHVTSRPSLVTFGSGHVSCRGLDHHELCTLGNSRQRFIGSAPFYKAMEYNEVVLSSCPLSTSVFSSSQ